jgi:hypothetical protein
MKKTKLKSEIQADLAARIAFQTVAVHSALASSDPSIAVKELAIGNGLADAHEALQALPDKSVDIPIVIQPRE